MSIKASARKKCTSCGKYNRFSKGLCKGCWQLEYGKPIRKISVKHQKTINEYSVIRKEFLKKHPNCQAKLKGCLIKADQVHHKAGKSSEEQYLNVNDFLAVCGKCHDYIETHPEFAKANGFSKNRL